MSVRSERWENRAGVTVAVDVDVNDPGLLAPASEAVFDDAPTPVPTPSVRLLAASTHIPLADGAVS